jgi:hypothetical protein
MLAHSKLHRGGAGSSEFLAVLTDWKCSRRLIFGVKPPDADNDLELTLSQVAADANPKLAAVKPSIASFAFMD